MINFNGNLQDSPTGALATNRGLLYGDAVFETLKVVGGKVLFAEDHYFRLMAAMRIVRMEIPMDFTLEYFEDQLLKTVASENATDAARVRLTVFRNDGGRYAPESNDVSFIVTAEPLQTPEYVMAGGAYEVDLYKDFYVTAQLLSSIKSTNCLLNVAASVYARENGLQDCLLVNDAKNVIESIKGNIFMCMDGKLITPPVSEGCVNGILRKQVLALAKKREGIEVVEAVISPFDLQKADELFLTNTIMGIQPITQYRKKSYTATLATALLQELNALILA